MRWLTQYMGALTHSKLDRAVIARYFAFLVISQLVIFTLLGVIFSKYSRFNLEARQNLTRHIDVVEVIVIQIGRKASFQEIVDKLRSELCLLNIKARYQQLILSSSSGYDQ